MKEKIVLGLSGGVDSAVAARILQERGYEVIGLFLDFGLSSKDDAEKLAQNMGIEFHVKYLKEELEKNVCSYFRNEYLIGNTPNPCIMCNPSVKFRSLCDFADENGIKYIATGHYANIIHKEHESYLLKSDSIKDQTYMLYRLPQHMVKRIVFPLSSFKTKDEVRKKAQEFDIFVKNKPDSMEVCFIPDNDHAGYIEKFGKVPPVGNFVDETGKVLGRHKGIHHYTVGQRKGLNIASTGRLYVHEINVKDNEVVLGLDDVFREEIYVKDLSFILEDYQNKERFDAAVKVRYSKNVTNATIYPDGTCAKIVFEKPVRAPTNGQSAVFYDGDIVIGGGIIFK